MDVSKPPEDYLEHLDDRMNALMEETRLLKEKYGFDKVSEAETVMAIRKKQKAASQLKRYDEDEKRFNYESLVEVIPEPRPIKPTMIKPEISPDWVAANKQEPDIKTFYDKGRFEQQIFKSSDFALTRESNPGVPAFEQYMTHFALANMQ